ncbi:hypothetical protein Tco_0345046 [Tanacetum coccineum]
MWLQQKMDKSAKRIATGVSGNMEGSQQMAFMSFSDVLWKMLFWLTMSGIQAQNKMMNEGKHIIIRQWVPPNGLGLIVVTDMAYFVESLGERSRPASLFAADFSPACRLDVLPVGWMGL